MKYKLTKIILLSLGLFFLTSFSAQANGPTYITGQISENTTWIAVDSPYVIQGGVTVLEGITLTIELDVVIKFEDSSSNLVVLGTLNAQGIESQPVLFTSFKDDTGGDTNGDGAATTPAPADWGGMCFAQSSNSTLTNVIIRYGGGRYRCQDYYQNQALFLRDSANLIINQSEITDNREYNIYVHSGNLTVTNTEIANSEFGVYLYSGSATIEGSNIHDHQWYGVYCYSAAKSLTLNSNNFQNNYFPAITDAELDFTHSNNTADKNTYNGFYIRGYLIKDQTWNADLTYIIGSTLEEIQKEVQDSSKESSVVIPEGITLTINEGVIIKPHRSSSALKVYGTLNIQGTTDSPVYITSLKDDLVGGDTNNDEDATSPTPTDWGGICFLENSSSILVNTIIRYGGGQYRCQDINYSGKALILRNNANVTINESKITNSPNYNIFVYDGNLTVSDNAEITNSEYGVRLQGGSATINNSIIQDHRDYGVYNATLTIIDAVNNWWGDPTGPYHPTLNPDGQGDRVSDRVDFDDWLGYDPTEIRVINVAIILAEPSDISHNNSSITTSLCHLPELQNKTYSNGYNQAYYQDLAKCVNDYYKENSYGTLNLDFTIYDDSGNWFQIAASSKDYGNWYQAYLRGSIDPNDYKFGGKEFVEDVTIEASNKGIDLSLYDIVGVVRPGTSRTGDNFKDGSWHPRNEAWPLPPPSPYEFLVSERGLTGSWTHEITHNLGVFLSTDNKPLCDLYMAQAGYCGGSTEEETKIREWDLMADGSLLGTPTGRTPSHLSSFSKINLNWLKEALINTGNYLIESLETMKFGDGVKRFNISSISYYLLEGRTPREEFSEWDIELRQDALVLYKTRIEDIEGKPTSILNKIKVLNTDNDYYWNLSNWFRVDTAGAIVDVPNKSFKINTQIKRQGESKYIVGNFRPDNSSLKQIWSFTGPFAEPLPPVTIVNHSLRLCDEMFGDDACRGCDPLPGWEILGDTSVECPAGYKEIPTWEHSYECKAFKVSQCCTEFKAFDAGGDCGDVLVNDELEQCAFVEDITLCSSFPKDWKRPSGEGPYFSIGWVCPKEYEWVDDIVCITSESITTDELIVSTDKVYYKIIKDESGYHLVNEKTGRSEYAQLILDIQNNTDKPIWYAHFSANLEKKNEDEQWEIVTYELGLPHEEALFDLFKLEPYGNGGNSYTIYPSGNIRFINQEGVYRIGIEYFFSDQYSVGPERKLTYSNEFTVDFDFEEEAAPISPTTPQLPKDIQEPDKGFFGKFWLLLLLLPILLAISVMLRLALTLSSKQRRIIEFVIIVLLLVFLLTVWMFILSKSEKKEQGSLEQKATASSPFQKPFLSKEFSVMSEIIPGAELINLDLDFHAYDDQGRHVGVNYETGEYENQIPGAIPSGDLGYDDEWIAVPEGTQVYFVVNSNDIQETLEIYSRLRELTDGIEDYEIQAVYYDEVSQRYESNIVTEDIKPGIELEHQVTGTHDITIGPGILIAKVDFNPDTLNLKGKGKWVTAYIELPTDYDPNLINLNTILLNNQVPAENNPKYDFVTDPNSYLVDSDNNGILERMVKFNRSVVQDILGVGEVKITITGELINEEPFQGSDVIRVISGGKKMSMVVFFLAFVGLAGLLIYRRKPKFLNKVTKVIKVINNFKRKR